jgi:hypothetical protein
MCNRPLQPADREREKTFVLAQEVNNQLVQMDSTLKSLVDDINRTYSQNADTENPVCTISTWFSCEVGIIAHDTDWRVVGSRCCRSTRLSKFSMRISIHCNGSGSKWIQSMSNWALQKSNSLLFVPLKIASDLDEWHLIIDDRERLRSACRHSLTLTHVLTHHTHTHSL